MKVVVVRVWGDGDGEGEGCWSNILVEMSLL